MGSPGFLDSDIGSCLGITILDDLRVQASTREILARAGIIPGMTLVEITYELQSPLTDDQLRRLGEFSNTYGLRRVRFDEDKKHLSFEYDASRLRETQVEHVLAHATIAVARQVTEAGTRPEFKI